MSYAENSYDMSRGFAIDASVDERAAFISKTYSHLAGAVFAFAGIEAVLFNLPGFEGLMQRMVGNNGLMFGMMIGFMVVSWVANSWALNSVSLGKQYAGLALYVVAEAIFFAPMLYFANTFGKGGIISTAATTTLVLFAVLTAFVFITRKDFSFLRTVLMFGGFAAMGLIGVAWFTGFTLGPIFTYAMIAFACGYILYDTSNVLHHYRTTQYVAASLALFASLALLFWYILRLFMQRD